MSATLYELADARAILESWLAETEGELTPEIEALLNELDGKADEKIERVALFVREQLAIAKAIQEEEARLRTRRTVREKAADSLKAYLQAQMERLGKSKVEGLLCTVAIQKNPPSVTPVTVLDEAELRNVYMFAPEYVTRVPESFALNKRAVLDAHRAGTLPDDIAKRVAIIQTQGLRIR